MLVRLTLLLIALPLVALAADAPPGGGKLTVPPPPKAAPAPPPPAAAPVSLRPAAAPLVQDPAECRRGCAESYYFCRANDEPETCGGPWGQCLAACSPLSPDPTASSAP